MSLLETAIHAALNVAGVTALVSTRIHWQHAPQPVTLPFVVVQLTSRVPTYTHDGDEQLDQTTFDVTAYGNTVIEARQVAQACRVALSAATVAAGESPYLLESEQAVASPPVDGSDLYIPSVVQSWTKIHVADT